MNAIDCASRLNATEAENLKKNGVQYVCRYLGDENNWKSLLANEVKAIKDAGLNLISIYETNPTKAAYFTFDQGKQDAYNAEHYANELGQPKGTAIYYTVDFDAQKADMAAVLDYFSGVREGAKDYAVGGYGSYDVIEMLKAHKATEYLWQTYAWSAGKISKDTHIFQYRNDMKLCGVSVDYDMVNKEPGAWDRPEYETQYTPKSDPYVVEYQKLLNEQGAHLTVDGIDGPLTQAAVKHFQNHHGLKIDGIVGPKTLAALKERITLYTVKSGDTLTAIAIKYHTNVQALVKLNRLDHPNVIQPGQKLQIPVGSHPLTDRRYVTVGKGENLSIIAAHNKLSLHQLLQINPSIDNPDLVYPGQKIRVK